MFKKALGKPPTDVQAVAMVPASSSNNLSVVIDNMTCASCVGRVEKVIKAAAGVKDVSINLATGRAVIEIDTSEFDIEGLAHATHHAGYDIRNETLELTVHGMSCASCVGHIVKALNTVPGVVEANVNLAMKTASVEVIGGSVDHNQLMAAIQVAGFDAEPLLNSHQRTDEEQEARQLERRQLRNSVILASLFTLPVFVLEMGSHMIPAMHRWVMTTIGLGQSWYLQFFLTTLVLCGPGRVFFRNGIPSLLHWSPNMNSLVALGTGAAWSYSVVATFAPTLLPPGTLYVYYEPAAMIVVLILVGHYLEAGAKGRTSEAIKRLIGLQAKTARVIRNGKELEIDIGQVRLDDLVQVRPGERLPVDGEVSEGQSYVDESMITGESIAVLKQAGDDVVGGTINKAGSFIYRTTKIGADTMLAQIIQMVEQAQSSKLPVQALVDRVTAYFVPAVMLMALLTFVVWIVFGATPGLTLALVNAIAVLIIACPCAMGLATPTSIMVGTGRAAEMGVLFRRGEALQTLRDTHVVALDKTGTLTTGSPQLTDLEVVAGFDESQLLSLVASVERLSEHPVAEAIVEAATKRGVLLYDASNFTAKPGFGVVATVEGRRVEIGADRYMQSLGISVDAFTDTANRLGDDAKTPLYVAIDGSVAAIMAVADPIKSSTPAAIAALHAKGMRVAMITGDHQRTAQAIAQRLDIDEVIAQVLPSGKVDAIKALQQGGKVAFVGDGINDAPALAQADVGIAIGTGTDVAIESADVVLMSGDLRNVPNAIALSRSTIRNIKQSLFWAFAYNVTLIPVAAGVLYPSFGILLSPVFAAAAMALSSVSVLGNALRLKNFQPIVSLDTTNAKQAKGSLLAPVA